MMALTRKQIITLLILRRRVRRRSEQKKKRIWVRKLYQDRKEKGEYHLLIREMKLYDHALFYQQFRMTPSKYNHLFDS